MQDVDGSGYGVPLNYVWDGNHSIYIHCAPEGHKLHALERHTYRLFLRILGIKALSLSSGNLILSSKEGFYSNNGLIIFAIFSSPSLSISSKALYPLLSTSMTAITFPPLNTGTTISERDFDEHAICPGNWRTFGTTRVYLSSHALPHTPRPFLIV